MLVWVCLFLLPPFRTWLAGRDWAWKLALLPLVVLCSCFVCLFLLGCGRGRCQGRTEKLRSPAYSWAVRMRSPGTARQGWRCNFCPLASYHLSASICVPCCPLLDQSAIETHMKRNDSGVPFSAVLTRHAGEHDAHCELPLPAHVVHEGPTVGLESRHASGSPTAATSTRSRARCCRRRRRCRRSLSRTGPRATRYVTTGHARVRPRERGTDTKDRVTAPCSIALARSRMATAAHRIESPQIKK